MLIADHYCSTSTQSTFDITSTIDYQIVLAASGERTSCLVLAS